eukprot:CAMPEP_0113883904 /NCGR_PEP_ID=MMETSP0780_2-20120614/9898_1 /TAXON_ID=652834 /ORGANISM="Palpitomonas bilix" /LENGTH=707 /DNA_ID=CAMNT_0000871339 /DNA_START=96 /DNA_END=2219 /DNA_ORIENTATION=+ /assembly_acc=CAM_ASM_000599
MRRRKAGGGPSPYRQSSPSHSRNGQSQKSSSPYGSSRLASMLAQYVPAAGYGQGNPYMQAPVQQFVFPEAVKIRDGLFLANTEAVQDIGFVLANKIDHVVSCDRASPVPHQLAKFGVTYSTFSWLDIYLEFSLTPDRREGKRIFQLFHVIDEALEQGQGIILHSLHDFTRAGCCLMAWLMWRYEWPLEKVIRFMQCKKPELQFDTAHIQQLNNLHKIFSHTPRPSQSASDRDFALEEVTLSNTLDNYVHADKPFLPDEEDGVGGKSTRLRWADSNGRRDDLIRSSGPSYNDRTEYKSDRPVTPIIRATPPLQNGSTDDSHPSAFAANSEEARLRRLSLASDSSEEVDSNSRRQGQTKSGNGGGSGTVASPKLRRPSSGSQPSTQQQQRSPGGGRPASAGVNARSGGGKRDALPDIGGGEATQSSSSHATIPRDLLVSAGLEEDNPDKDMTGNGGEGEKGDDRLFLRRSQPAAQQRSRFSSSLRGQVENARHSSNIEDDMDDVDAESTPASSPGSRLNPLESTYPPNRPSHGNSSGGDRYAQGSGGRKERPMSSGATTTSSGGGGGGGGGGGEKGYMRRTQSSIAGMHGTGGGHALNGSSGNAWGRQSLGAFRTVGRKQNGSSSVPSTYPSPATRPGSSRPQRSSYLSSSVSSPSRRPSRESSRDPSISLFTSPATLNSRKGGGIGDINRSLHVGSRNTSPGVRRSFH